MVTASAQPHVSAIVPLAISDTDAAFVMLAGQAVVLRVVRALLDVVSPLGQVIVAAAEPLAHDVRETLTDNGLSVAHVAVATRRGTRADCVAAGLEYVASQRTCTQHVLLYDIRQPLAVRDVCNRVLAALRGGSPVVMPAVPVTDSVKVVDERGSVASTLDRSTLQIVQYPRGFAADVLARLLARRASDEFDELDEAVRAEVSITTVEGDGEAFSVELPRDAQFVEAVIESRRVDPRVS